MLPLTFERLRIVELFAEMLHCSNMSLLNRPPSFDHLYDSSGRLQGGLSAMKDLGAVSEPHGKNQDDDMMDDGNEIEPALEFPVTSTSHDSSSLLDSDDDMSSEPGSSDDDAMEEIMMSEEPQPIASPPTQDPSPTNGPSKFITSRRCSRFLNMTICVLRYTSRQYKCSSLSYFLIPSRQINFLARSVEVTQFSKKFTKSIVAIRAAHRYPAFHWRTVEKELPRRKSTL